MNQTLGKSGGLNTAAAPMLELMGSRQFNSWLDEQHCSLAFTTYQTGKLFLVGLQPDGRLTATPTAGTGTLVNIAGATVNGNSIKLDFGANGLGGVGRAGNGFYRILVDTDGDGTFNDAHFEFFRLWGNSNGDGRVTDADGTVTEDLSGDGRVNATDQALWRSERSFKLHDDLFALLDD